MGVEGRDMSSVELAMKRTNHYVKEGVDDPKPNEELFDEWDALLGQKKRNLESRMNREISGVELDRRDREIDEKIAEIRGRIDTNDQGIDVKSEVEATVDSEVENEETETETDETVDVDEESKESLGGTQSSGQVETEKVQHKYDRVVTLGADEIKAQIEKFKRMEGSQTKEELYSIAINGATDMRSLFQAIKDGGDITGSDGHIYKKEDLIRIIRSLKGSEDPNLDLVTRTHNLRNKVKLILLQEELSVQ